MAKFESSIEILEYYKDFEPPIDATAVTRKLIDNIPQKYLLGLGQIIATNLSGMSRRELNKKIKSRGRKVSMTNVCGLYHHRTASSSAWIEIFVDQIADLELSFFQKIPFLREMAFAEVLYHEVGHHIHTVLQPEYRDREDVADEWQIKLKRLYAKKKYWYLMPFFWLLWKISQTKVYKHFDKKVLSDTKTYEKRHRVEQNSEKSS